MTHTICKTFRSLAFNTHQQLEKARYVNHQPLEETFTDINILELKARHPLEIYSKTFNKREEGNNGADWEWWLTNSKRDMWLGLRVQAKILNLQTNTFQHLHYKSKKTAIYQIEKLKNKSVRDGLIPLYCFFTHIPIPTSLALLSCKTFLSCPEFYGCALTSLEHVAALQATGKRNDLASVMSNAAPWHCLVCCKGYASGDLPTSAWAYLQKTFKIGQVDNMIQGNGNILPPGPRLEPPQYVYSILRGEELNEGNRDIRGILIIAPRNDDDE